MLSTIALNAKELSVAANHLDESDEIRSHRSSCAFLPLERKSSSVIPINTRARLRPSVIKSLLGIARPPVAPPADLPLFAAVSTVAK